MRTRRQAKAETFFQTAPQFAISHAGLTALFIRIFVFASKVFFFFLPLLIHDFPLVPSNQDLIF